MAGERQARMSYSIQLPDEVYEAIKTYASQRGETPETLIRAWAATLHEQVAEQTMVGPKKGANGIDNPTYDPWADFRGSTTALSPDSIERHDAYLASESLNVHESDK